MNTGGKKLILWLLLPGISVFLVSCKTRMEEATVENTPAVNSIRLSEAQIRLANISTAVVREGALGRKMSLTGTLKINEQSAVTVSSRAIGRIEKLYFRNTGEQVNKGEKLYDFYCEELVSAQREYLTLESNNWNYSRRYEPSLELENKLLLLGMIPAQVRDLSKSRKILFTVTIYSPVSGKIRSINVSEGQYVEEGDPLFDLADDNQLWVEAQVYPAEIQFLKTGMPVTVILPAERELQINSSISFINPSFEAGKNVTLIRSVITNPDGRLHPGMFAILRVNAQFSRGLVVPSSAIIHTGGAERVWVREENGDFSSRTVSTGLEASDSVIVLSGLEGVENIVSSGAYLLNSEFILKQGTPLSGEPVQSAGTPGLSEK